MKRLIHARGINTLFTFDVSKHLTSVVILLVHFSTAQKAQIKVDMNSTNSSVLENVVLPQPQPGARETLDTLLSKNHRDHHINYQVYFANHMPHAICSLYSLGATKERLVSFYDDYARKLRPVGETKFMIDENNWTKHIGDSEAYPEYLKFFDNQVSTLGHQKTLDTYLPRLTPGLVGAALHPLIHIGYGLEYNSLEVLSEGLSYACTYYNAGGELIDKIPNDDTVVDANVTCPTTDLLEDLRQFGIKARPHRQPYHKGLEISTLLEKFVPDIKSLLGRIQLGSDTKSTLDSHTNAIIHIFFGTYRHKSLDFFLAHGFTGNHAIRTILPYLSVHEQKRLLRVSLLALIYLYIREGMPEFDDNVIYKFSANRDMINWDDILQKVVTCADEHVIKVVRSLLVARNQVPDSIISHKLIDRCAFMMVNTIKEESEWVFDGIGYLSPDSD